MKIPMIMQHRIYLGFRFAYRNLALFHKLMVSYITLYICNLLCITQQMGVFTNYVYKTR